MHRRRANRRLADGRGILLNAGGFRSLHQSSTTIWLTKRMGVFFRSASTKSNGRTAGPGVAAVFPQRLEVAASVHDVDPLGRFRCFGAGPANGCDSYRPGSLNAYATVDPAIFDATGITKCSTAATATTA